MEHIAEESEENPIVDILVSLEVDIEAWEGFHLQVQKIASIEKIDPLNITKCDGCNELFNMHLDSNPKNVSIYSGTLNMAVYGQPCVTERFEKAFREGALEKLEVWAGPYIMEGIANPFLRMLAREHEKSPGRISFFPALKRLPVHAVISDNLMSYEEAHSEFFLKRVRWIVKEMVSSARELIREYQGAKDGYIDLRYENKFDDGKLIRAYKVSSTNNLKARLVPKFNRTEEQKRAYEITKNRIKSQFPELFPTT